MKTINLPPLCLIHMAMVLFGSLASGQDAPSSDKVAEWKKGAESGDVIAQFHLGLCYAKGWSVPVDEGQVTSLARKALRKAAAKGDVEAQYWLGNSYEYGFPGVVEVNAAEAVNWYRKAAEQGYYLAEQTLGACYALGKGVEKDPNQAIQWYRKTADKGNAEAQYELGQRCNFDRSGILSYHYAESVSWFRKAAEQGHALAQDRLGDYYACGEIVDKNEVEAARWYRKAAEQGNAPSQMSLGICYSNGQGVVKDDVESYKWTLLAAALGNEMAKNNIPIAESRLSPTRRAEGQRLAKEWEGERSKRVSVSEAGPGSIVGEQPKITGTGFLITLNGYLVTNHHVVKNCSKVRVQTVSGLLDAVVVRVDAASDLALLKIAGNFNALPVASSRAIRLGAMVATIGFPNIGLQGIEPKLSKGDISSLAGIQDDVKQFQISVPVQPGNSGGALVDDHGNVVGVVTAQLSQEAALASTGTLAQSVNYAVKSSYVLSFLEAVPEIGEGLIPPKTSEQKFESVVDDVKKATVLIVGY